MEGVAINVPVIVAILVVVVIHIVVVVHSYISIYIISNNLEGKHTPYSLSSYLLLLSYRGGGGGGVASVGSQARSW